MTVKRPEVLGFLHMPAVAEKGIAAATPRCPPNDPRERQAENFRDQLVIHLPRLRRFAYSLTRDGDASNDLVQETCARALSRAELWEPGTRLDSWLFRIAQNLWFDRIRAERTRGNRIDVEEISELAGEDGRDVTHNRLSLDEVMRGIARLKPDHQVVVGLVCVDGMTYKEAAEVLELPIGTVMSRLSRARLELNAHLEKGAGNLARIKKEQRRG